MTLQILSNALMDLLPKCSLEHLLIEQTKAFVRRIWETTGSEETQALFFQFSFLSLIVWAQPLGRVVDVSAIENSM